MEAELQALRAEVQTCTATAAQAEMRAAVSSHRLLSSYSLPQLACCASLTAKLEMFL
jgi:hypothetical protein